MALRAVSLQMDSREVQAGAPLDNAEIEDFTFQTLTLVGGSNGYTHVMAVAKASSYNP